MSRPGEHAWSADDIARLRELWARTDPQLSTAEIGRKLHVSKNAVVGKAGRLNLPARPSPIGSGGRASKAAQGVALSSKPDAVRWRRRKAAPAPSAPPAGLHTLAPLPLLLRPGPRIPCCWPDGEECAELSLPGKPYCEAHSAGLYVAPRRRAA